MQNGALVVLMTLEITIAIRKRLGFIIMRDPGILHMAGKSTIPVH